MQGSTKGRLLSGAMMIMIVSSACSNIASTPAKRGTTPSAQSPGQLLYSEYCMPCHGVTGAGDGRLSYLLYPKPRDFTSGRFKLRSTVSGELPTNDDLAKIIVNGMPGTAMPSFYFLDAAEIKALVDQVKQLGGFADELPVSVELLPPPAETERLVVLGKQLYSDLGCNQCHGNTGKGDGPSASLLIDDSGYPIQVRDFTRGTYLGGGSVEDLYLRFVTGMTGTPMPSYLEILEDVGESDQERQEMLWGLVYYVKSLETADARAERNIPPVDGSIFTQKVADTLTEADLNNPRGAVWKTVPAVSIPISRLWQRGGQNLNYVDVKALYNNRYLAVLLEWEDGTENGANYRVQDFQDAAAVQFSLSGEPGFHGMGSPVNPANIWFWKAEWQWRQDRDQVPDIELAYGRRASDGDVETYPFEMAELTYLPGRDAGNISSIEEILTPVEDVNAAGPETLTPQPDDAQNVLGKGVWDGRKWRVVLVSEMNSSRGQDVQFHAGGTYPVAFAVWDGSERDRDGQKMISTWYTLVFQQ